MPFEQKLYRFIPVLTVIKRKNVPLRYEYETVWKLHNYLGWVYHIDFFLYDIIWVFANNDWIKEVSVDSFMPLWIDLSYSALFSFSVYYLALSS